MHRESTPEPRLRNTTLFTALKQDYMTGLVENIVPVFPHTSYHKVILYMCNTASSSAMPENTWYHMTETQTKSSVLAARHNGTLVDPLTPCCTQWNHYYQFVGAGPGDRRQGQNELHMQRTTNVDEQNKIKTTWHCTGTNKADLFTFDLPWINAISPCLSSPTRE